MSYFAASVIKSIEEHVKIRYVDRRECKLWNENRRGNELRLLTGWMWYSTDGHYRQGLKTQSAAYRDAYYSILKRRKAPGVKYGLRLVHERKVA